MPSRFCFGIVFLIATLATGQLPLATFSGAIHGVSKKQITIETAEGNLLDFDINKKTRVLRGKKQIAPEDLQTGDSVTIEAKQEKIQYLIAVTITAAERANTN
jgi:hypothetical protein